MRSGGWQTTVGTDLGGHTLGLLGLGRIGSQVAAVGRAFGMDVIAWSPHLTDERAEAAGARAVALDDLLAASHVVSVHLVLGQSTQSSSAHRELALMRPDALSSTPHAGRSSTRTPCSPRSGGSPRRSASTSSTRSRCRPTTRCARRPHPADAAPRLCHRGRLRDVLRGVVQDVTAYLGPPSAFSEPPTRRVPTSRQPNPSTPTSPVIRPSSAHFPTPSTVDCPLPDARPRRLPSSRQRNSVGRHSTGWSLRKTGHSTRSGHVGNWASTRLGLVGNWALDPAGRVGESGHSTGGAVSGARRAGRARARSGPPGRRGRRRRSAGAGRRDSRRSAGARRAPRRSARAAPGDAATTAGSR